MIILFVLIVIVMISGCIQSETHRYIKFNMDSGGYLNYYADCICTGNAYARESFPPQYVCEGKEVCKDMNILTKNDFCAKSGTDKGITISAAIEAAVSGNCSDAKIKEPFICNENTGTWWIDLDIEKEGCSPACVIDVMTRKTEINWRCTGLIVP